MESSRTIPELLERNNETSKTFVPLPNIPELKRKPATAVVACADMRCVPERFLDLQADDAVIVFRTTGGRVASVIKDIVALDTAVGFSEIMVIHHTDCGASVFTNELLREKLHLRLPHRTDISGMDFGAFQDIKKGVRDDLDYLKKEELIRPELASHARGFVFDIKTGKLSEA